ncbi:MAG TPA: deoxyribodipyrimidine photolyase [Dehalococcoidia bacterium]
MPSQKKTSQAVEPVTVPLIRIRQRNRGPVNPDGKFVLYWMIAYRRTSWNFALQRAAELAASLGKPLLILEALRCDYPWASDRLHRFVLDGMADNARALRETSVGYYPYVELRPGEGRGLLESLAGRSCAVVTDDYPAFFLPRAVSTAAERISAPLEEVDSNGLLPMREADKAFLTAHSFRRFLQRQLPAHLDQMPEPDPVRTSSIPLKHLPADILKRWPPASNALLADDRRELATVEVDHQVRPVDGRGGADMAASLLHRFVEHRLPSYAGRRNEPSEDMTSELSPYLHFGHISAHEVFAEVTRAEAWSPGRLGPVLDGRRSGWWGVSASSDAFLDQLVTWRELGFNFCHMKGDYDRFESLPDWARTTLHRHAADTRPYLYSRDELESAATHDPVWNAAQRQLLKEGRIHGYLRMLWGKKILEWTHSPEEAFEIMIHLNNRFALDGRDPNSYSGISWCLGRYDRPWGPERAIFGKVRYMSSENTRRKLNLRPYLERYQ